MFVQLFVLKSKERPIYRLCHPQSREMGKIAPDLQKSLAEILSVSADMVKRHEQYRGLSYITGFLQALSSSRLSIIRCPQLCASCLPTPRCDAADQSPHAPDHDILPLVCYILIHYFLQKSQKTVKKAQWKIRLHLLQILIFSQ